MGSIMATYKQKKILRGFERDLGIDMNYNNITIKEASNLITKYWPEVRQFIEEEEMDPQYYTEEF